MKRIAAVISLLLFTLTFTPAELWHDCLHHHHETSDVEHSETIVDGERCAICDHHFSVYELADIVSPTAPIQFKAAIYSEAPELTLPSAIIEAIGRGPPALS